jgi:hypothetical protein
MRFRRVESGMLVNREASAIVSHVVLLMFIFLVSQDHILVGETTS